MALSPATQAIRPGKLQAVVSIATRFAGGCTVRHQVVFFAVALTLATGWSGSGHCQDSVTAELKKAFATHCVKCHGVGDEVQGELNLKLLTESAKLLSRADLLEDILKAIEHRDMPPEGETPLPAATRQLMTSQLRVALKQALKRSPFAPTPIRRMNRFQYNNAVQDLLELDRGVFALQERLMRRYSNHFDPKSSRMPNEVRVQNRPLGKNVDGQRAEGFMGVGPFPQDLRAEHGFDNQADHLTLSPLLMESFLKLSQTIVESRDLKPQECRSWKSFFAPPETEDGKAGVEAQVAAARQRLKKLLRRAFRRPVEKQTLDRFVNFAEQNLRDGADFTETMKTVVGATIASPDFLYLYNVDQREGEAGTEVRQPVDDFELASRLSFFLWSSIPDDTLLDLAEAGRLSDPETLSAQINRMLNDRKMVRFCDSFPGQWLQLDRLITSIPDRKKFPYFYFQSAYRASIHSMLEPLLLFETVYLEDRSVMDLLQPDFTWDSDVLAASYQGNVPRNRQVQVLTFRRIPLTDRRRGGVITNAAVMTMTSLPSRTRPITRGAWVNTVIFNDPPEPPPADVPPLPEPDEEKLSKLTIRERFAEHRKREDCAGCHRQIDPLGFALENYGPTGIWRDSYENGRKVDAGGKLFNQHEFKTILEFKDIVVKEKQRFLRGFTAHLLSYALGRELNAVDSPALDEITRDAMNGEDSLRTLLKRVALSNPFRHKNTDSAIALEPSRALP